MTKKEKVEKDTKKRRVNQTVHERAMTRPQVRDVLFALRDKWDNLSPLQRGEQLNELKIIKCSVRGVAKELGVPATTIRRYMALADSEKSDSGWIEMMERTLAKRPKMLRAMDTRDIASQKPSKVPAKKDAEPIAKRMSPVQDAAHSPTTQQAKEIASPPSTRVPECPILDREASEKLSMPGESEPRTSLVDLYRLSKGQSYQGVRDLKVVAV